MLSSHMEGIIYALSQAIQINHFLFTALGVVIGIIAGAIPGITASMAIAVCLPLTFYMPATSAFSLLLGIYIGAMAGGSISAILINIPGNPAAIITGADGYPMAQRGEAGKAIFVAFFSSTIGSLISFIPLFIFAPMLARMAIKFQAPDLFAIILFGMVVVCSFAAEASPRKGFISALMGLVFMTIGLDRIESTPRFTFGTLQLQYGVDFLPVMIGMFAIPQILQEMRAALNATFVNKFETKKSWLPKVKEILIILKIIPLASLIGVFVGITPGTGSAVASIFSYHFHKRISKHPERYGTGIVEGVAAAEAANNGVTGGALIPMLTLGIPGDPVTAIMLGALLIQGLEAGPLLFRDHAGVVFGMFGSFLLACFLLFAIGIAGISVFSNVLKIPKQILFPIILVFCLIGSYSLRNSSFDVGVMLFFGILGYVMILNGYPILPLIIALILGPPLETHLRMSLITSGGSPWIFFTRKVSLIMLIAASLIATYAMMSSIIRKRER